MCTYTFEVLEYFTFFVNCQCFYVNYFTFLYVQQYNMYLQQHITQPEFTLLYTQSQHFKKICCSLFLSLKNNNTYTK